MSNMKIDYQEVRRRLNINDSDKKIADMLNNKNEKITQLSTIPFLWPISDSMGLSIKGD